MNMLRMNTLDMSTLRVSGFLEHSTVNGEGFRSVLFLSGCGHNCPGCHNKEMQDFKYGEDVLVSDIISKVVKNVDLIDGVTLSGGEPFEQCETLLTLLNELKRLGLSVWLYTGYLYEELLLDSVKAKLLSFIDVLIDGKFVEAYADENLKYRGSSNQRILKLTQGKIEGLLNY